ncbi:TonB-dependent receptor [Kineobactrum salinum]|uniref:TonB-dependent receptor plug domain-containing protein n=1 Tax=Kineobactrum salinum TaxID=2708301 RepID=A0A6C0U8W0_9GAMM|nr:TonB-dependent receptor plug domain-containing protein [Kineobactrum salinum]QIB67005.1 TonB-dependent receptor plug domain-containing protein [Kineobactrum salinum]
MLGVDADADSVSRGDSFIIDEILVTAQKREERLINVPIAITAVTGEEIEDKGYGNISELLQRAPGVSVTGGSAGTTQVQVRGVSSLYGAATVGYYLDEIPFSFNFNTALPEIRAWDLERVEVLRGPQGTLYGANSIGGTIRTLTKNPSLSQFEAKGEAGVGFIKDGDQVWEVKGALNVPIVEDRMGIRLAATHYKSGGFVDSPLGEDIDDVENTTLRGKIALAPTEDLQITLSAWSLETERDNLSYARPSRVSTLPIPSPTSNKIRILSSVIEKEMPSFNIVSATSYLTLDLPNVTPFDLGDGLFVPVEGDIEAKTFAQEVRLVSSGPDRLGGPWAAIIKTAPKIVLR